MPDALPTVLQKMLDIAETQVDRKRDVILPASRISGYPFERADQIREFHAGLQLVEKAGAILIEWEKFHEGTQLSRIRLVSASLLAQHLRTPLRSDRIEHAVADVDYASLPEWLVSASNIAKDKWQKGQKAFRLGLESADKWPLVVKAAVILESGLPNDEPMDYRQFGARFLGNSKLTKSLEGPLAALFLWHWNRSDLSSQDVLKELNLERLEHPILMRGPFDVSDGQQVLTANVFPYVGFPSSMLNKVVNIHESQYILTIENLSSFIEYTHQIKDKGIILYTAGYPTSALQGFYQRLCNKLTIPIYHWGDTDFHGYQILKVLQSLVPGKVVKPHLMDIIDGEPYSRTELSKLQSLTNVNNVFDSLINKIIDRGYGKIEQEMISAVAPVIDEVVHEISV